MKRQIIYIKYGELTLKGKNRQNFVQCLGRNIKKALAEFANLTFHIAYDFALIDNFENEDQEKIITILKQVNGIAHFSFAYKIPKDLILIKETCAEILADQKKTFKVEVKRKDKTFPVNSDDLKRIIAGHILTTNQMVKVDIHHPDILINVDVNYEDCYVYYLKIEGARGLPVGINGKALVLLSGGIDSPVAARLVMKRGISVDFITFVTPPHTSENALQKVKDLTKLITMDNKLCNSHLYICNFTPMLEEISHISKTNYRIILMRRYFMRIAKHIAQANKCDFLVTGESLNQVASQTTNSMKVISQAIDDYLIVRPLITYDKNEIIDLAIKYNTYETSILPYDDSCAAFAPPSPTTSPKLETVINLEQESIVIDGILESTLKNHIQKINVKE
ncbi:tRNA 4-thiouridine(8) synthase ThiI [Ureaplasma miroungigenitalium]|uniref:Probable tRNA sulfurtransferase n=1 Tax=Ureaplasma miroungigenitalium TaxID=1042321 RepID=A0ABT3BMY2_9BACT|nr:tRNA uracil 4-sulfurtransferase ThiI [Ureaplasma miroungigenitalium]MCV3728603.1 tRNA 4-thiouridine(8) synthase ThiI [Ureaplasma miroungigenitalium]MCV3734390.1 tRNA 4-thiouridine(8) synthase ThiI [Ureaplasma miroungigenitalium]